MGKRIAVLFFFWLSLTGWVFDAHANPVLGTPVPVTQSAVAESSHVFKATSGNIYSLTVTPSTTAGYLLVFDATTAPSNGAVTPNACYSVAASTSTTISYADPFPTVNGIVVVFSTTGCFTQTSSNAFFSAQVK